MNEGEHILAGLLLECRELCGNLDRKVDEDTFLL